MRKIETRAYHLFFTKEEVELMEKAAKLLDEIGDADEAGGFLESCYCINGFSEIAYEITKIANAMEECIE